MSNWQPHGKGSRAMRAFARALCHVEQYGGYDDEDDYSSWKKLNAVGEKMFGKKENWKKVYE